MQAVKHPADEMTPWERKKAIDDGRDFDRYPAVPFMSLNVIFPESVSGIFGICRKKWRRRRFVCLTDMAMTAS